VKTRFYKLYLVLAFSVGPTVAEADLYDDELPDPTPTPAPTMSPVGPQPVDPDSPEKPLGVKESPTPKAGTKTGSGATKSGKTDDNVGYVPEPRRSSSVLAPSTTKTDKKKKEKKEPVKYQSNGLNGLRTKGTIELLDDVKVTQGTLKMEADEAKIDFDEATDEVTKIVAAGQIKMFRYDEDSGEQIQAFGDRMTFLNSERKVILEGNARLFRGANLLRGQRLIYELDTGWIRAEKVDGELHPDQAKGPKK